MFDFILTIHILGAAMVGLAVFFALRDVVGNRVATLATQVHRLSFGLFFQIATGSIMAVLTPGVSLIMYCQNMGIYATVVLLTIFVVYKKMLTLGEVSLFPRRFVAGAAALSTASIVPVFVSVVV